MKFILSTLMILMCPLSFAGESDSYGPISEGQALASRAESESLESLIQILVDEDYGLYGMTRDTRSRISKIANEDPFLVISNLSHFLVPESYVPKTVDKGQGNELIILDSIESDEAIKTRVSTETVRLILSSLPELESSLRFQLLEKLMEQLQKSPALKEILLNFPVEDLALGDQAAATMLLMVRMRLKIAEINIQNLTLDEGLSVDYHKLKYVLPSGSYVKPDLLKEANVDEVTSLSEVLSLLEILIPGLRRLGPFSAQVTANLIADIVNQLVSRFNQTDDSDRSYQFSEWFADIVLGNGIYLALAELEINESEFLKHLKESLEAQSLNLNQLVTIIEPAKLYRIFAGLEDRLVVVETSLSELWGSSRLRSVHTGSRSRILVKLTQSILRDVKTASDLEIKEISKALSSQFRILFKMGYRRALDSVTNQNHFYLNSNKSVQARSYRPMFELMMEAYETEKNVVARDFFSGLSLWTLSYFMETFDGPSLNSEGRLVAIFQDIFRLDPNPLTARQLINAFQAQYGLYNLNGGKTIDPVRFGITDETYKDSYFSKGFSSDMRQMMKMAEAEPSEEWREVLMEINKFASFGEFMNRRRSSLFKVYGFKSVRFDNAKALGTVDRALKDQALQLEQTRLLSAPPLALPGVSSDAESMNIISCEDILAFKR